MDINRPLLELILWLEHRYQDGRNVRNRGNLDKGLARMIVERSGHAHTQQEIADFCGVSRPRISAVEVGNTAP